MSVVEFMMLFDWRGDIRDANYADFSEFINSPPAGIHPGRWRGMVWWVITRLKFNDGMRL